MLAGMFTVFIALGSNLGDRAENLRQARIHLNRTVRITAESSIVETPPWGYTDQPDFLNQVVRGKTTASPQALIHVMKSVEKEIGRTPNFRYGPRLIDLDLLYYADLVLETPGLTVPHPRLQERDFVLRPLAEIAPDWMHPVLGKTSQEMLDDLTVAA